MLLGHVIDSSLKAYGLKAMAERDLGIFYPSYDDIVGKRTEKQKAERITLDKQPPRLVQLYNMMDTVATYKLYEKQISQRGLNQGHGVSTGQARPAVESYFEVVEKPLAPILSEMSTRGVRIDLEYLRGLKETLEAQRRPLETRILNELGSINLNSPKQLLEALNAKKIYPELKGKPSTDKRALARHADNRIVQSLLQFSELDTLLSSFVTPYLGRDQEYCHPFFNQVGTRTGRLSCSNPNLLQIPRKTENGRQVRRMFIPREGMFLGEADYAAIEPRLMAHLSGDPELCALFAAGIDFHQYTADRLGISRDKAKILNLSVGYRATFKSVGQQLGVSDAEAQEQIDQWWNLFPGLRRWQDRLIFESKRSGMFETLLGRRIRVDGLTDPNQWKRESAERQLINNIAQASAREVIVMAMIRLSQDSRLSPTFGLLIQIYDSLVFETPERSDIEIVRDCMENAVTLKVPLVVEIKAGPNWADVVKV